VAAIVLSARPSGIQGIYSLRQKAAVNALAHLGQVKHTPAPRSSLSRISSVSFSHAPDATLRVWTKRACQNAIGTVNEDDFEFRVQASACRSRWRLNEQTEAGSEQTHYA
jgi:hypothetical protein